MGWPLASRTWGLIAVVLPTGLFGAAGRNKLANAHARVAPPSRIPRSVKFQPAWLDGSLLNASTSTLRAGSSPLIVLHTKNDVRGVGVPPLPACAAVVDSASIPIPANTPESTLRFIMVLLVSPPRIPLGEVERCSRHSRAFSSGGAHGRMVNSCLAVNAVN